MKCHGCGCDKDPTEKEAYPYPDEGLLSEKPICPLFELDCQPYEFNDSQISAWLSLARRPPQPNPFLEAIDDGMHVEAVK